MQAPILQSDFYPNIQDEVEISVNVIVTLVQTFGNAVLDYKLNFLVPGKAESLNVMYTAPKMNNY